MNNFNDLNIHVKIRQIRECKNLTRKQVANQLNIETRTYSYIESGKTKITVDRLLEICSVLKCSVEDLLNFNSINPLTHNKQENKDCNEINNKEIIDEKLFYISLVNVKDKIIDGLKNEILHLKKIK
jgi:transcriptional regulator with XRE-family HTH domain